MKRLKNLLTHDTVNSFEPCVILPAWKSVIVDWITLFTFGLCRWRWNGVTMDEWWGGYCVISRIESETDDASTDYSKSISTFDCDATD